MANVTRGNLPGTIGMTHPMAKLIVMLLVGVFGAIGFRHLLRGFGDRGIPGPVRMTQYALRGATRLNSTVNTAEHLGARAGSLRERMETRRTSGNQSEESGKSPQAPGRKAHPPASSQRRRPPSAPSSTSTTRPGPGGPGRGPGSGGGTGGSGAGVRPGAGGAGSAGATAARTAAGSAAARTATKVLAPEVAMATTAASAAEQAAGHAHRRGGKEQSGPTPGRSAAPAGRVGTPAQGRGEASGVGGAGGANPARSERGDQGSRPHPNPPGRGGAAPQ
jgi:hypothetical protein